jgi:predicted heme/steroid binding protein
MVLSLVTVRLQTWRHPRGCAKLYFCGCADPPTDRQAVTESKSPTDLASVLAALEAGRGDGDDVARRSQRHAHRRGVLTLVMVVLLVGGVIQLFTSTPATRSPAAEGGTRASIVFSNAGTGTCLGWPPDAPDKPSFVQCRSDHMFEVAKPVGMNSFGEPCQLAVREYLGTHYDPNSRFTISVLWAGDADDTDTGARNLLCGLELLGPGGKPVPFKGRIVDLDQSKVWPAGTCLGIDAAKRSTDLPVDCSTPHGLEITGTVGLAERFPGGPPSDQDQRAFITDGCTRAADGYLAPVTLAKSGLALGYETISPDSWTAGSRQVYCGVGRPDGPGWSPVTGTVRTQSLADVPPPAPPTPSEAPPPPPVYEQPLIPIAPLATPAAPPPPAPSPAPAPTSTTTTTATTESPPPSSSAAPTTTGTTSPGPPPALGPAPGPETPSESSQAPDPNILQIPGLPPITLPGYVPPEPAAG